MGKLQQLWDELRATDRDDPRRAEIQSEINKVEKWMISKGIKQPGTETKWNTSEQISNRYPWHVDVVFFEDMWMVADLNGKGINYNADKSVHICDECKR